MNNGKLQSLDFEIQFESGELILNKSVRNRRLRPSSTTKPRNRNCSDFKGCLASGNELKIFMSAQKKPICPKKATMVA
jgi:hypothetical protein